PRVIGWAKHALIRGAQGQRGQREQDESGPEHAQRVAKDSQLQRRKEAAEAAERATSPVTGPVSGGDRSGTSLNTAPFPSPMSGAQPSAPTVKGIIAGHARSTAKTAMPANTQESTCAPPMRSASQPPIGRMAVASTTKPAARKPASAGARPNWARSGGGG